MDPTHLKKSNLSHYSALANFRCSPEIIFLALICRFIIFLNGPSQNEMTTYIIHIFGVYFYVHIFRSYTAYFIYFLAFKFLEFLVFYFKRFL